MSEECPIVENIILHANTEAGELRIGANIDHIMRFPDEQYDYLMYFDTDLRKHKMAFLGQAALKQLVDYGVPETKRDSITRGEYDHWIDVMVAIEASDLDEEIDQEFGN